MTEPHTSAAKSDAFPWTALLVLAAAVFLSITGELLPTGLLPEMSAELGVTEPAIGLLVTVFAFTVVVTSAPITAWTKRVSRRKLLLLVLVVLALSTFAAALAPTYAFLVGARIVGGVAHGMFWTIVAAYAGDLVPQSQVARAVSVTLGGGTLALVIGVPLAATLGQAFGWRAVFVAVAILLIGCALLAWRLLPDVFREPVTLRTGEIAVRDSSLKPVLLVCAVTAITMLGQYSVYTYIAPLLTQHIGVGSLWVGPLLFVYGIAGALGLVLVGTPLARNSYRALLVALVLTGIALVGFAFSAGMTVLAVASLILWGTAFGAIPPLLQTRVLQTATERIRDMASALYTTAFNVGIGGGALVGAALYAGVGLVWLPIAFAIVSVISFVTLVIGQRSL